jgi:hypothetical protein
MRGLALVLVLLLAACGEVVAPPTGRVLSQPELKLRLLANVGDLWYCDPDFYPIARQDEQTAADAKIGEIQKDTATYAAILDYEKIPAGASLTKAQVLAVYRDWKKINHLALQPSGDGYRFSYLVAPVLQPNGKRDGTLVEGTIDKYGAITVTSRTAAGPPNCPICLAADDRIATPSGDVLVGALRVGDIVWTADASGARVAAPVLAIGSVQAPAGHTVVRLALADGRVVRASPGHPLADGRRIGEVRAGDVVDGSVVVAAAREPYDGETHDLLPAGPTGTYWANGVRLGSTLR